MSQRRRPSPNGGAGEILVRLDPATPLRRPIGRSGGARRLALADAPPGPIRLTLRRWMIVVAAVAGVAAFALEYRNTRVRHADYWAQNARLRQDLADNLIEQNRLRDILKAVRARSTPDVLENVGRARDDLRRREEAIRKELSTLRPW